jgi:hypothetical protein
VTAPFSRDLTEAERVDGMVKYLHKQLDVKNDDTTGQVTIEIIWPDAQMGYRIIDTAQRAFLEAKHVEETTTIAEQAAIIEGHAAQLRREIDTSVREIQALRAKKLLEKEDPRRALAKAEQPADPAAKPVPAPAPAPVKPAAPALDDASLRRLSELTVMIETKRNAVRELDEFRQRRVAELSSELESKQGAYTEAHPAIADLRQSLAAASRESAQVKNLKNELQALGAEHERLAALAAAAGESVPRPSAVRGAAGARNAQADEVIRIEQMPAEERDPEIEYARAKLKHSITSYQELEQQIQRARIALDTAEAAFKYRYTVVTPPEIPREPQSPNAMVMLIGALFGGLLLGLVAAVALELRRGMLHDVWQVEQFLALPVLANVRARAELSRP